MGKEPEERPLPNAGDRPWSVLEPRFADDVPRLVYQVPLESTASTGTTRRRRRKSTVFEAPKEEGPEAEIAPEPTPGSWKKRGFPEGMTKLLPFLLHEFKDLTGFDEKEIRYGAERGDAALPRMRRRKKRRLYFDAHERALACYPILKRTVLRLVSLSEEPEHYRFVFAGYRPESVHVLGRVLETKFKFRLEDLSRFATHGDHLVHALEHVDAPPCLDPDGILYCPAVDSQYPFKFATCANSSTDNVLTYQTLLKKILDRTEPYETFRDRFFSEIKLGFEKFGPGCATPEFQEVELRLWKLVSDASNRLQIHCGKVVLTNDGAKIRAALKEVFAAHAVLDAAAALPDSLCAFYRTRFDIPFGKLFAHALAGLDEIAKQIPDCNLKDRPRDIETLTQLVTRVRKLTPSSPLENLEALDKVLEAAYDGKAPPAKVTPAWVRRYLDAIFTGTEKFDSRRYGSKPEDDDSEDDEDQDEDLQELLDIGGG